MFWTYVGSTNMPSHLDKMSVRLLLPFNVPKMYILLHKFKEYSFFVIYPLNTTKCITNGKIGLKKK